MVHVQAACVDDDPIRHLADPIRVAKGHHGGEEAKRSRKSRRRSKRSRRHRRSKKFTCRSKQSRRRCSATATPKAGCVELGRESCRTEVRCNMSILVFIEHKDCVLNKTSLEAITAAQAIGKDLGLEVSAVIPCDKDCCSGTGDRRLRHRKGHRRQERKARHLHARRLRRRVGAGDQSDEPAIRRDVAHLSGARFCSEGRGTARPRSRRRLHPLSKRRRQACSDTPHLSRQARRRRHARRRCSVFRDVPVGRVSRRQRRRRELRPSRRWTSTSAISA